jgi:hypothetical protein
LIAASVGAATKNYLVTILLFATVLVALSVQWLAGNRFSFFERGHLMISVDQPTFPGLEAKLTPFLKNRLSGLSLETMSVVEGRMSLHYHYHQRANIDWAAIISDLNQMASPAHVEIFIG